jgi:hypothetical protein
MVGKIREPGYCRKIQAQWSRANCATDLAAMTTFQLQAHPTTPCPFIEGLEVTIERQTDGAVLCRYELRGAIGRLAIPTTNAAPARTDGLWQRTCFEVFLGAPGALDYREFNFSPSGDWAAYRFHAYRDGMADLALDPPPQISYEQTAHRFAMNARFDAATEARCRLALSAVLKDCDGGTCYWALNHPPGKPDFHHEEGFVTVAGI